MGLTDYWNKLLEKYRPGRRFPERDEKVTCPDSSCDRTMLFRDVFEHYFLKHTELGQISEEAEKDFDSVYVREEGIRGQMVDNYNVEWLDEKTEEKDDPLEVVQTSKNQKELKEIRRKYAWKDLLNTLKNQDKVEFGPNDHYGSLRGRHIGRQLEKTLTRVNLPLEVSYKGETTIVRKTGEICNEL